MQHISPINGTRHFGIYAMALALAALLMVPAFALADPSTAELRETAEAEQQATEELEEQAAAAEQRAEEAGDADALQAQAEEVLQRLNGMAETLDRTAADYAEAIQAQANAEGKRDAAAQKIEELAAQIDEVQGELSTRARSMYRNGTGGMVDLVLGSESFEELATNWDLLERMNEADAALIERASNLKAETEEQHEIYEREASVAAAKSEEAAAAKAEAEATAAAYQQEYDGLSAQAEEALQAAREAEELRQEAEAQRVVQEAAEQAAADAEQREAEEAAAEEARRAAEEAARQAQAAQESDEEEADTPTSAFNTAEAEEEEEEAPAAEPAYSGGGSTVDRAYASLGIPYSWGATGPNSYDCSGLVGYCITGSHDRLGTTYTFMNYPQVSNPQPGDICTSWTHCGIYIGNGQMIHAPQTGDVVKVGPVQSGMIIVRYPG